MEGAPGETRREVEASAGEIEAPEYPACEAPRAWEAYAERLESALARVTGERDEVRASMERLTRERDRLAKEVEDWKTTCADRAVIVQRDMKRMETALASARRDLKDLRQQVEDTIMVARTDEDAGGFISAYHFQTGAIHRLLAAVRAPSAPCEVYREPDTCEDFAPDKPCSACASARRRITELDPGSPAQPSPSGDRQSIGMDGSRGEKP